LLLLLLLVGLAGCRVVELQVALTPVPEQEVTPVPRAYSGTITCVGSSVLTPLINQAGERFRQAYPFAHIVVITATSQSALSAVQDGGADLGLSDISAAAFRGVDDSNLFDYPVAASIFTIIVHPSVGLTTLTRDHVRALYTGDVTNWQQIGGPDLPVVIFSRPKGAGPRALFRQLVLDGTLENNDVATPEETNQDVVEAVRAQPGAVGYVSLSALTPGVQMVTLDNIEPTSANVRLGHYRFWGTEHIYTKGPAGGLAGSFIDYLLSTDIQNELFKSQGFIPRVDIPEGNP
jgi:phosphate transport system substrate-binding protein